MGIKKFFKNKKLWLFGLSFVMLSAASVGTMSACKDDDDDDDISSIQSSVEDCVANGNYYVSAVDGEYTLSFTDDKFALAIGADVKIGTYDVSGNDLQLIFEDDTYATATFVNGNVTLSYGNVTYNFLKKTEFTVSYSVDGSVVGTAKVMNGKTVSKPSDPTKAGQVFIGWYADEGYTTPFGFGATPVTGNVTVYARFVEKTVGRDEFKATYVVDGAVYSTQSTVNGVVYNLPVLDAKEGAEFAGWWTSDDQDGSKLTCQYTDQVLKENTNLYAVWKTAAPLVSVTETGVKWNAVGTGINYVVDIYVDGTQVKQQKTAGTEYKYDFTTRGNKTYKVVVTANDQTTTAYYNYKALDRVSTFTVAEPSVLVFNAVENAEKYLITVVCGNENHTHVQYDNGKSTNFNFANCDMKEGGIKFTVTAVANGYTSSVSDAFEYERTLEALTGLTFNAENGILQWNTVEKATSYEVAVTQGNNTDTYTVYGKTFSMKNYTGAVSVKVSAKATGYVSSSATVDYTTSKMPVPTDVTVNNNTIQWTEVTGAEKYSVMIDGVKVGESETNELALPDNYQATGMSYSISVQAVSSSASSYYSDPVTVTYGQLNSVSYTDGMLRWAPVGGADYYEYTVNGLGYTKLENGETSAKVEFNKAGDNVISFKAKKSNGVVLGDPVELVVKAYELTLDTRTSAGVSTQYKALGDTIDFPENLTYAGYKFEAWYNVPGGADANGLKFEGNVYNDTSVYALYAYWTSEEYEVTLMVEDQVFATEKVKYNQDYKLPTPEDKADGNVFNGWKDENEILLTDAEGYSKNAWSDTEGRTLYATWVQALTAAKVTAANGSEGYALSMAAGMKDFKEITVPATFTVKDETLPVVAITGEAFANCTKLETINLPDTIESIFIGEGGANAVGSAFYGCTNLKYVNVYATEGNHPVYFKSVDGVLLRVAQPNNEMENGTELHYFPAGRTGVYQVPGEVNYIPQKTFQNAKITDVIIPASVSLIGKQAFEKSGVTSVVFAEAISSETATDPLELDASVFAYCYSLTTVDLPARLVETDFVGKTIFDGCTSLREINVIGKDGTYTSRDGMVCDSTGRQIIYCPIGKTGELKIPATIQGIAENAFIGCTKLTKVVIGGNVAEIGAQAFMNCRNITTIEFKGTNTSGDLAIGEKAFYGCTALRELSLGANVTSVAAQAFGNTPLNTRVVLNASSDVSYADGAFIDDEGKGYVQNIVIGANMGAFEIKGVFSGCPIKGVTVEDGNPNYESDDDGVLYNNGKTQLLYYPNKPIANYVIPETVTTLTAGVFEGITYLPDTIVIGKNVTTIGVNAFKDVANLTTVQFESGRTASLTIGDGAFEGCTNLSTIELPETLTAIGANAFRNCSSIQSLVLPSTLTKMGNETSTSVFDGCTSLATISVANGNTSFEANSGMLFGKENDKLAVLYFVPAALTGDVVIPSTVHTIPEKAFYGHSGVTSIAWEAGTAISDNNLRIGDYAFAETTSLTSVTLPTNLTVIPTGLLKNSSVQTVFVPNTVVSIELEAFNGAERLYTLTFENDGTETLVFEDGGFDSTSDASTYGMLSGAPLATTGLILPERVKFIPNYYFANTIFDKVVIPASIQRIGTHAFYGSSISDLDFAGDSSTRENLTLGYNAFAACNSLVELTVPSSIKVYDGVGTINGMGILNTNTYTNLKAHGAFKNCTNLTTVIFEDGLTEIASGMFSGCYKLGYSANGGILTTIPDSVTSIGDAAFAGCALKGGITIGSGVKSIGSYAFQKCHTNEDSALKTISIPANVETIGVCAFYDCKYATSLAFATENAKLYTIGDYAFSGCVALKTVNLPYNTAVTELKLGRSVFNACTGLTEATVPSNVLDLNSAFNGCNVSVGKGLTWTGNEGGTDANGFITLGKELLGYSGTATEVEIPDGIEVIAEGAFKGNNTITKVTIPDSVKRIGATAFQNCTALATVEIGENSKLISVGAEAFSGAKLLTAINLASVTELGNKAFYNCATLASVALNDNLEVIGEYTFYGCKALASIDLPAYLTTMGNNAFDASGLTSIVLPELLVNNDMATQYWFQNCKSLVSVEIKSTNLGIVPKYAFYSCSALEEIIFPKTGITILNDSALYGTAKLTSITFPDSLEEIWGTTAFWKSTVETYDFSNTQLNRFADSYGGNSAMTFYQSKIKTLILPVTMTVLSPQILSSCSSLETVIAPGVITLPTDTDGNTALGWKSKLTRVELPALVEMGKYAFSGCTSLTEFVFPETLKSIGEEAFYNTKLSAVNFGSQLETIGAGAFYGNLISEVTIPVSLTAIGEFAFDGCENLTTFYVSSSNPKFYAGDYGELYDNTNQLVCFPMAASGVEGKVILADNAVLGAYAFNGCANIREVVLPSNTYEIPEGLFYGSGITTITIPNGVATIGAYAFAGCTGLTTIHIPESVTTIANNAFEGSGITSITGMDGVRTIGDYAFKNCTGLTSFTIPKNVSSYGMGVLDGTNVSELKLDPENTVIKQDKYGGLYDGTNTLFYFPANATGDNGVVTLEAGVKLSPYIFSGITGITEVVLPSDLKSIPLGAFYNSGIKTLTIPASVTEIAYFAGDASTDWYPVTIVSGSAIETLIFAERTDNWTIPDSAFDSVTTLNTVTMGAGIKEIEANAFYGCSSLSTLTLSSSLETIGTSAFRNCKELSSVTLPASLKSIGSTAFRDCTILAEINLPSGLKEIGGSAFRGCNAITNIYIPSSVETIGNTAFYKWKKTQKIHVIGIASTAKPSGWASSWYSNYSSSNKVVIEWNCTCND